MVEAGIRRDVALEKQKLLNELTEDEVQFLKAENDERERHNKLLEESEARQKRIKDTTEETRKQTAGIVGNVARTVLGFEDLTSELDLANFSVVGMAQGFTDVFNISNLILNVLKGMAEQMYALADLQAGFTKETGMGYKFAMEGIEGARVSANEFAGALIATRSREHITIDLINRMAPDSVKRWLSVLTQAFAAFICGVIGWHSAEFVQAAWQYGDTVFGEVPAWPLQAIMPLTFSLMAVRFALQAINDLLTAVRPGAADA